MKNYLEILSEVCGKEIKLDEDVNTINAREAAKLYAAQLIRRSCVNCQHNYDYTMKRICKDCALGNEDGFKIKETLLP